MYELPLGSPGNGNDWQVLAEKSRAGWTVGADVQHASGTIWPRLANSYGHSAGMLSVERLHTP